MNAVRQRLDAHRWHWQHGPIDIVAEAHGAPDAVAAAHEAAWERFRGGAPGAVRLPGSHSQVGEIGSPSFPSSPSTSSPFTSSSSPPSPSSPRRRGSRGAGEAVLDPRLRGDDGEEDCGNGTGTGTANCVSQAALKHGVLTELVGELRLLRQPVSSAPCPLHGPIAQRMWQACVPFLPEFITPMAAVAGSVAQELIACYLRPGIERAWLNNGGDIALHLAPGHSVRVGLFSDLARFDLADMGRISTDGRFEIRHTDPVRGVATSGWRGRSFSMGIADSVTVLAATAAQADAAASIIANAVNVDDAAIERQSANTLKDDTDLGERMVTTSVPPLHPKQVQRALDAGEARARALQQSGLVWAVLMVCQEQWRHVEPLSLLPETQKIAGAVLA